MPANGILRGRIDRATTRKQEEGGGSTVGGGIWRGHRRLATHWRQGRDAANWLATLRGLPKGWKGIVTVVARRHRRQHKQVVVKQSLMRYIKNTGDGQTVTVGTLQEIRIRKAVVFKETTASTMVEIRPQTEPQRRNSRPTTTTEG